MTFQDPALPSRLRFDGVSLDNSSRTLVQTRIAIDFKNAPYPLRIFASRYRAEIFCCISIAL